MHISEGVLAAPVLAGGAALAAGGVALGLRRMPPERVPAVALLAATFFVTSLIRVPVGPANVHLVLNGLAGVVLGWSAFPAILVGLVLQAVLFQFGGLTTLGVNTVGMALPAVGVSYLFPSRWRRRSWRAVFLLGAACGALAVLGSALLLAIALISTGGHFRAVARLIVVAHLPLMVAEGVLTGLCVAFLRVVKPELLQLAR